MLRLTAIATALILLLAGCQADPSGPVPGGDPVGMAPISTPESKILCSQVPSSGGLVKIETSPSSLTLDASLGGLWGRKTVTARAFRDDPNTPGVQYYCEDPNINLNWGIGGPGHITLAKMGYQIAQVWATAASPTTAQVYAYFGAFPGTVADTTFVTIVP